MSEETQFPVQKLGEVVEVLDHLRIPVNSEARAKRKGDVPYYGANGLQGWIDKPIFNEPLILMAEDGGNFDDFSTRPIAYRIDGPAWVNNHAHIIKAANPKLHSFIYWSVAYKDIRKYVAGGTRQKLNQSALKEIEIPCPPENEGEVAGKVLDTLDTQIQKTEALIAKLEKVKEALLHDLLTRGIDENGRLRPSPEQAPELYKESLLGLIPKEWDVVHAEEVGEIVTGSTPPSTDLTAWGGDLPFFTPGDIAGYEPLQSAERTISKTGVRHVRVIPSRSTLVVCIGSTIGKVALTSCEGATNQQINAVIPSPAWDVYFVFQAIRNHIGQIHAWAGLQAVPIVNKSTFGGMLIPQPSAAEQANISKAMRSLDVRINEERIKARKLSTEKAALMDDLLTGRVRVTPLLEQVQATTLA